MATPLDAHVVLTVVHYISPTIQPLPPHLVASQLAFRQSCLKLTPDDPAYLYWPSSDDQRVLDALEAFQQRPIDDLSLDFHVRYTADDSLFAHVQLAPDADPTGLRIVFQWEEGAWKYTNAARMPFPHNSSPSLDDLPELDSELGDGGSGGDTPDSYWDAYGQPDRDDPDAEFEREQPETAGNYWDMYNSVQGSGDSVIPSPTAEKHRYERHDLNPISYSYADMHPTTDPMESLSDRLQALSQRPPAPEEDDTITVVDPEPATNDADPQPTTNDLQEVDALKESLRGVYRLWKATRTASTLTDHEQFLSVVHEVLAEE
ncbi:hypothetical protein C8R44DRAFT_634531 [Mycena epipterygia]|nr:hypothetical protein C8R44DRAFT_634531 [Mycena epipterygia]